MGTTFSQGICPKCGGTTYVTLDEIDRIETCWDFDKQAEGCGYQDHVIWAEVSSTFNWKNREL